MSVILSKEQRNDATDDCITVGDERIALCKAQAIHLMRYLLAPCEKHPQTSCEYHNRYTHWYYTHRYLCPECIAEVKRELGI